MRKSSVPNVRLRRSSTARCRAPLRPIRLPCSDRCCAARRACSGHRCRGQTLVLCAHLSCTLCLVLSAHAAQGSPRTPAMLNHVAGWMPMLRPQCRRSGSRSGPASERSNVSSRHQPVASAVRACRQPLAQRDGLTSCCSCVPLSHSARAHPPASPIPLLARLRYRSVAWLVFD